MLLMIHRMQVYLVGGAVRDALLGLPVKERDWVVVGGTREATAAAEISRGGPRLSRVSASRTHEEYALARLERKVAPGYRGFSVEFGPDVTLEEDLARRDLTINAIAQAGDGNLLDPFGGRARPRSAGTAPCLAGLCRGSGSESAGGAIRCALRSPWVSRSRRKPDSDARHGRARRGRCVWCPNASGRKPRRRCVSRTPASFSRCCANAAHCRRFFRRSTRCSACRNPRNGTRKSTPACTR